jgi:uncharacterized protein
MDFSCEQCGKCCIEFGAGLSVSREEIAKWEKEGRYDILDYVFFFEYMNCSQCNKLYPVDTSTCPTCGKELEPFVFGGDLWFDPETGKELESCPFLEQLDNGQYICQIQDSKPERCKNFPKVISTECDKCGLNFVKHFKDQMFPELSLEEYFEWSMNDFYDNILQKVDSCPKCNNPIQKYHPWAIENCVAIKNKS